MKHELMKLAPPGDVVRFAWSGLSQMQNVSHVANQIIALHKLPKSFERDARKQARQIRYCVQQAEEYFRAASSVTMSTRPLLLYYGVMSLALAEILLKGTGDDSLDRARGEHAHHGLTLKLSADPSRIHELSESAANISAEPLVKVRGDGHVRFGTFELWHRVAREAPLCGEFFQKIEGGRTRGFRILMQQSDDRMPIVPSGGLTLLECFRSHPGMTSLLESNGLVTECVRGTVSAEIEDSSQKFALHFQPGHDVALRKCCELIKMHPSDVNRIAIKEFYSGMTLKWSRTEADGISIILPGGIQEYVDEFYLLSELNCLNEFGILYYGIYILGNYVRYYPDMWMCDLESASLLYLAASAFSALVEERVPLLSLSELSRVWYMKK